MNKILRLRRFPEDLLRGVTSGYPWCCVAAFSVVNLFTIFPPHVLGARRDRGGYVPCRVFHRPHVSPEECREPWKALLAAVKNGARITVTEEILP